MFIRIGCVDGKEYVSDRTADTEVEEYLKEVGGKIGTGTMSDVVVNSKEEFGAWFIDMCKYNTRNDTQSITIEYNGRSRMFNSRHIVWAEVVWDS